MNGYEHESIMIVCVCLELEPNIKHLSVINEKCLIAYLPHALLMKHECLIKFSAWVPVIELGSIRWESLMAASGGTC